MEKNLENYVTFFLEGKEYALNIEQVNEVIRVKEIISIPDTASYVEGIITMRSKIIPVINLRKKMNLPEKEFDRTNCIIISEMSDNKFVGLLVDQVGDLIAIDTSSIDPFDDVLKEEQYLQGVARMGDKIYMVVDFSQCLTQNEKTSISDVVREKIEIRAKQNTDG